MLDALRKKIDAVDDELLTLLEKRAEIALAVARAKEAIGGGEFYDPKREQQVLERLVARAGAHIPPSAIRAVFREVISACLSLQQPVQIAVLGPSGTFTSVAARQLFGDAAVFRELPTIEDVFDAVARGSASRGVVPFENSTEGIVAPSLRALLEHNLQIEREHVLDVVQCLFSTQETLERVGRIYSHPQALAQCSRWLRTHAPAAQLVPVNSTAAAMHEALSDAAGAAVGARQTGERAGLRLIAERIQDLTVNQTRFLVLSPKDAAPTGEDRTLLAFSLKNGSGTLRKALSVFEAEGVNLSRLSSHPSRERAWEFYFLCELDGHRSDPPVERSLEALNGMAERVKLFGSFPRAQNTLD